MAERRTERGQPNLCGRPKGPHDTCRNSIPDAAQWCTKCRSKRGGCFLLDGYDTDPGEQAIRSVSPRLDHSSSPRGSTHLQLDYVGHGIRSDGLEIPTIEEGSSELRRPRTAPDPVYTPGDFHIRDQTAHARKRFHGRRGGASEVLTLGPPPQQPDEPEIPTVFAQQSLEQQHGVSLVEVEAPQTRSHLSSGSRELRVKLADGRVITTICTQGNHLYYKDHATNDIVETRSLEVMADLVGKLSVANLQTNMMAQMELSNRLALVSKREDDVARREQELSNNPENVQLSLEGICRQLINIPDDLDVAMRIISRSSTGIGVRAKSVNDMSERSKSSLAKLLGLLLKGIMRIAKGSDVNAEDVLNLLFTKRNVLSQTFKTLTTMGDPLSHPVVLTLKNAIVQSKQLGMRDVTRQLTSVLVHNLEDSGITCNVLCEFLSEYVELSIEQDVKIICGRKRRGAKVVKVFDDIHTVRCKINDDANVDQNDDVGAAEYEVDDDDYIECSSAENIKNALSGELVVVPRRFVKAVGDAPVTSYQVNVAKKHGRIDFPGAPVTIEKRTVSRLPYAIVEHFVQFCTSPVCLRILDASVARKSTVQRVDYRARLYRKYLKQARASNIKTVGQTFFYSQWPKEIKDCHELAECLCDTCYHCGSRSFIELREIMDTIGKSFEQIEGVEKTLEHARNLVKITEEMFDKDFFSHFSEHSAIGTHCSTHGLSAPLGDQFGSECDPARHLDLDGNEPPALCTEIPTHADFQDRPCASCNRRTNVGTELNWPIPCDTCENVVHNRVNCLMFKPALDVANLQSFKCHECEDRIFRNSHRMDCDQCNARFRMFGVIERLLEYIKSMPNCANSDDIDRWIKPRVDVLKDNIQRYAAHKMQDAHQRSFQTRQIKDLKVHQVIATWDYAAKMNSKKTKITQKEGYTGQVGCISRHTITFLFRPTREEHPDEHDDEFFENHLNSITYNLVSDNADQNTMHAAQTVKAAFKLLNEEYPRLTEVHGWSDGANDYVGTVFLKAMLMDAVEQQTGMTLISHHFSIPGKAVNDMVNGQLNQSLKRLRQRHGEGADQQTAREVVYTLNTANHKGVKNVYADVSHLAVDMTTLEGVSLFYSRERVDESHVRVRPFAGLGAGSVLSVPTEGADGPQMRETLDGAIAYVAFLEEPGMLDSQEQRNKLVTSRTQRRRDKLRRDAERREKASKPQTALEFFRKELLEHQTPNKVRVCPKCLEKTFLVHQHRSKMDLHFTQCQGPTVKSSTVPEQIMQRVGRAISAEEHVLKQARESSIAIFFDSLLEMFNLGLEDGPEELSRIRVTSFSTSDAFKASTLEIGSALVSMHGRDDRTSQTVFLPGHKLDTFNALVTAIDFQFPVILNFELPPPPLPIRGWAGKIPRRPRLVLTEEQETFLRDEYDKNKNINAPLLRETFNDHFKEQEEYQLDERAIGTWIARQYVRKSKEDAETADDGTDGDDEGEM